MLLGKTPTSANSLTATSDIKMPFFSIASSAFLFAPN